MRKFMPVTLAIALVAIAAVAILTSGRAMSFSTSEDNSDTPAPIYSSDSQTLFHFGPDFLCLIDDNGLIECLGSDTHGVVSEAPTRSGFTEISGGDSYACAYHADSEFDYCWGSIDRQPSDAPPEPTPTEESAPTVEPTQDPVATEVPNATVEPIPTPEATPEPDPCELSLTDDLTLPVTLSGSWIEECGYPIELDDVAVGDRYYRWVIFEAAVVNSSWIATLESDEDTILILWQWDEEDEEWDFVEMNDDIVQGNTNSRIEWTPTQDQSYLLDLTTYTANTLGEFTLSITTGTANSQSSSDGQSIEQSDLSGAMPLERRQ